MGLTRELSFDSNYHVATLRHSSAEHGGTPKTWKKVETALCIDLEAFALCFVGEVRYADAA